VYIKARKVWPQVHLFTQYGDINPKNITDNDKCFSKPWDGAEPFENVSERFNECIEYACAALSPYSDAQIMNWATLVVYTCFYSAISLIAFIHTD
jgi:hypothetical protein